MTIKTPREVADAAVKELLTLPWEQRTEAIHYIKFNGIFCVSCGYGSETNLNPDCQCENNE